MSGSSLSFLTFCHYRHLFTSISQISVAQEERCRHCFTNYYTYTILVPYPRLKGYFDPEIEYGPSILRRVNKAVLCLTFSNYGLKPHFHFLIQKHIISFGDWPPNPTSLFSCVSEGIERKVPIFIVFDRRRILGTCLHSSAAALLWVLFYVMIVFCHFLFQIFSNDP